MLKILRKCWRWWTMSSMWKATKELIVMFTPQIPNHFGICARKKAREKIVVMRPIIHQKSQPQSLLLGELAVADHRTGEQQHPQHVIRQLWQSPSQRPYSKWESPENGRISVASGVCLAHFRYTSAALRMAPVMPAAKAAARTNRRVSGSSWLCWLLAGSLRAQAQENAPQGNAAQGNAAQGNAARLATLTLRVLWIFIVGVFFEGGKGLSQNMEGYHDSTGD